MSSGSINSLADTVAQEERQNYLHLIWQMGEHLFLSGKERVITFTIAFYLPHTHQEQ